jgi:hypothetical protein
VRRGPRPPAAQERPRRQRSVARAAFAVGPRGRGRESAPIETSLDHRRADADAVWLAMIEGARSIGVAQFYINITPDGQLEGRAAIRPRRTGACQCATKMETSM